MFWFQDCFFFVFLFSENCECRFRRLFNRTVTNLTNFFVGSVGTKWNETNKPCRESRTVHVATEASQPHRSSVVPRVRQEPQRRHGVAVTSSNSVGEVGGAIHNFLLMFLIFFFWFCILFYLSLYLYLSSVRLSPSCPTPKWKRIKGNATEQEVAAWVVLRIALTSFPPHVLILILPSNDRIRPPPPLTPPFRPLV